MMFSDIEISVEMVFMVVKIAIVSKTACICMQGKVSKRFALYSLLFWMIKVTPSDISLKFQTKE